MKNLIIIAIAFFSINAIAQDKQTDQQKKDMMATQEMRQKMTPEESAQVQTKKMTLHLDLTEEQQKQVYKILIEEAKERDAKRDAKQAQQLKNAEAKKDQNLEMQNARLDNQKQLKEKMKAVLTTEQFEKFDAMMEIRQDNKAEMKKMKE